MRRRTAPPKLPSVPIPRNIETVRITYMVATAIYEGSDGDATKGLYARLEALGPAGAVAMNLFRAHKASTRAKVYRGGNKNGSWKLQAYDRKAWSLENLTKIMARHGADLSMAWGWGVDPRKSEDFQNVLFVELPTGQVSFHHRIRGAGPDYDKGWDGVERQGQSRICRWVEQLFQAAETNGETNET